MALTNRTLFTGDNLYVLRGMNSDSVDLIYLDPPFNSNATYSAPIGSAAAGAAFKDSWSLDDVDAEWHGQIADEHPGLYKIIDAAGAAHSKGMQAYLIMMAIRLIEMQRVLRPTGSLYLHCDPTASHYLKALMDCVFGRTNFRNEIVWSYRRWPSKQQNFQRMHDIILRYSNGAEPVWNQQYEPPSKSYLKRFGGKTQVLDPETKSRKLVVDTPTKGMPMRDTWDISVLAAASKERCGYPTQKPLKLLERIIRASTNEGDFVFDPFCGCATTLVAAEKLSRNWGGAIYLIWPSSSSSSGSGVSWAAYSSKSTTAPTSPSAQTKENYPRLGATRTGYMASRKACAPDARRISRSASCRSITASRKPRVVATTTTICRCCARDATYGRVPERWLNCSPSCGGTEFSLSERSYRLGNSCISFPDETGLRPHGSGRGSQLA